MGRIFFLCYWRAIVTYQPFLIAPFSTGLDTDAEPWLLPQDAFETLENFHIYHGVIEKRDGYIKLNDLVQNDGSNWDISAITQADPGVVTVTSTAGLANGNEIEIRNVSGMTEVNGNRYYVANLTGTTFELTDENGTDVDTSGFTAYTSGGEVYLVPANRVMGLLRYVDSSNVKQLLAFDDERACIYNTSTDRFDPLDTSDIFTSSDTDYVVGANWSSTASTSASTLFRLYFTNGVSNGGGSTDGIRYYDPATSTTATTQYNPNTDGSGGSIEIRGCKLIFAYQQRLVLLYTYEAANTYPQRARWCQIQNPNDADAWDDTVPGKGGYVDAPTGDQIISAQFIQNRLIVFFTESVWALVPTPDPALPFRWEKINSFRACDGKMASVGFDRYSVSVGSRGIVATDGVETRRIDNRIEDFANNIVNAAEFEKTFMLRSYRTRRLWVLYAGKEDSDASNALIFDDESGAYSIYDIAMNVLGYGGVNKDYAFQDFTDANFADGKLPLTFNGSEDGPGESTFLSYLWDDGDEAFLGGDRNGTVYLLQTDGDDVGTDITATLESAYWNPYREQGKECQFGYIDIFLSTHQYTQLTCSFYKNNEFTPYSSTTVNCLPPLTELALISKIETLSPSSSGVTVYAGEHGLTTGDEIYIYGVNGMDEINGGEYSITVVDDDSFTISIDASAFGTYTTGGVVTENPYQATKVWKRIYAGGTGYQHKIKLETTGTDTDLEIHAFQPWFRPVGKRLI